MEFVRRLIRPFLFALIAWGLVYVGTSYDFRRIAPRNASMEPTYSTSDITLSNERQTGPHDLKLRDCVYFSNFEKPDQPFLARIVALPGDHLEIKSGRVFLNGEALDEPYITENANISHIVFPEITIPRGHIFVLMDKRTLSSEKIKDSREVGPIPYWRILSKVVYPSS